MISVVRPFKIRLVTDRLSLPPGAKEREKERERGNHKAVHHFTVGRALGEVGCASKKNIEEKNMVKENRRT